MNDPIRPPHVCDECKPVTIPCAWKVFLGYGDDKELWTLCGVNSTGRTSTGLSVCEYHLAKSGGAL